jgi:hypothetical protein
MTRESFLALLDNVMPRGSRDIAKCPAHADRLPSLQITAGDKGLLLKCWAGCSLGEICASLGISQQALFYDALDANPQKRKAAAQERERRRQQQAALARTQGRHIDALRAADYHIRSRAGLDISGWSDQKLDAELTVLADAYALLESEERDG